MTLIKEYIIRTFGYEVINRIKNLISKSKSTNEFSEVYLIADFLRKCSRSSLMIDVGTHYGESAYPFLQMGWKVIGFEPDPANFGKIKTHRKLILCNKAVSNKSGLHLDFYISPQSSGISSLIKFHDSHKSKLIVETITLNDVLKKFKIEHIEFLKIDTEGNDLFVLEGLDFSRVKPRMILCEFENSKTEIAGYNTYQLGEILIKNGYVVFISEWEPIIHYGMPHKWSSLRRYPTELNDNAWGNFIAVEQELLSEFLKKIRKYLTRNEI
jgi:FkbM family methyltransferase